MTTSKTLCAFVFVAAIAAMPLGASAGTYSVTVRVLASSGHVTGGSIDCYNNLGTCFGQFDVPTTLAAVPDPGFTVKSWSGGCTPSADKSTCSVPGTASTVVYVYFQSAPPPPPTSYNLVVRILAYSGTVTGTGGISCTNLTGTCSAAEGVNADVTLRAIPTQGYAVKNWYGCTPDATKSTCSLKMDTNKTVSISFGAVTQAVACSVPNGTGTQTFDVNTNSYGPCVATACVADYSLFNGACYKTFSDCTVPNGTGTQGWNATTGAYDACVATACDPGYTLYGGACYANTQNCTVPNGSGSRTFDVSTGLYGACVATACDPNYILSGGTCAAAQVVYGYYDPLGGVTAWSGAGWTPPAVDAQQVTVTAPGTAVKLGLVTPTGAQFDPHPNVRLALYSDVGGIPAAKLAETAFLTNAGGRIEASITPAALQPGKYWIAYQFDSGLNGYVSWAASPNAPWYYAAPGADLAQPLPSTFPAGTSASNGSKNVYVVVN